MPKGALGPTQPYIQWTARALSLLVQWPRALSLLVQWQQHDANHSPSSDVKVILHVTQVQYNLRWHRA
jgi:hypothetical protein